MIDLTKTYKLRNEKRLKLISQPRIMKVVEEDPGRTYALEAEWEDTETGEVSTEVWTAEGEYYAGHDKPHDRDLVEVETQPIMLDPTKKYRLRNPRTYTVINPIIVGQVVSSRFPITAQLLRKSTGTAYWETWTADGHITIMSLPEGYSELDKDDMDLVEDVPEWKNWPIDAKVLCRDDDAAYTKGYYAGERKGRPTAWANGGTSWSTRTRWDWDEIKLAEPE